MKTKFIFFAAIMFSSVGFVGCGGAPQLEVSDHRVGEKVFIEKLSLTVESVDRNAPTPEPGELPSSKIDLGVHLVVMNEGKYSLSFKLNELVLQDDKGNAYVGYPRGGPGSLLSTGRFLAMGDRITGILAYQVPQGAKGLVLIYRPVKLRNKVYRIHLS